MRLPGSLGGRLLLGASLLVVLAVAASMLLTATLLERFGRAQIDAGLDARLAAVAGGLALAPDGAPLVAANLAGEGFERPGPGWWWQVWAPGGVAGSTALRGAILAVPADPPRRPPGGGALPWPADLVGPGGLPLIARVSDVSVDGRPVRIVATAPRAALSDPLRGMLAVLALAMAGLGGALLATVLVGVRLGLRPLRQLRTEVADIRAGRAERLDAEGRPAEVGPLVAELNRLLDANAAGLERARRSAGNLAHGLKTPLATLAVTLAEPGRDPDGVLAPLVGSMNRQIRHHLARARAATLAAPARARTDVAERLAELAAVMGKVHAERAVAFEHAGLATLPVACEAQDMDELFGNILDNAFAHARGRVRTTLARDGAAARIEIEDDGRGMNRDEIASVLTAGRRLDESTLGYGFGLSISTEIAALYGGEFELGPSGMGGLSVRVSLPTA